MEKFCRLANVCQSRGKAFGILSFTLLIMAITGIARGDTVKGDTVKPLAVPQGLSATNRQLAIALAWQPVPEATGYQLERASTTNGPFKTISDNFPDLPFYNDFVGVGGATFYYRIRSVKSDDKGRKVQSDQSPMVAARSDGLQPDRLLTEVQEASFDYFYKYAHPVSGLARISAKRDPTICAIGASGMTFFNLGVGIERGFITRQEGVNQALKELKFLTEDTERFHGAFPHLVNGQTGRVIPFSRYDDGADIVETAFLIEGALFAREYFSRPDPDEIEIRRLANDLWRIGLSVKPIRSRSSSGIGRRITAGRSTSPLPALTSASLSICSLWLRPLIRLPPPRIGRVGKRPAMPRNRFNLGFICRWAAFTPWRPRCSWLTFPIWGWTRTR